MHGIQTEQAIKKFGNFSSRAKETRIQWYYFEDLMNSSNMTCGPRCQSVIHFMACKEYGFCCYPGVGVSDMTAMTITAVLSDAMSLVGVVFTVALLFRYFTRICNCTDNVDKSRDSRNGTVTSSADQRRSSRVTMDNWQPRHSTEMFDIGLHGGIP